MLYCTILCMRAHVGNERSQREWKTEIDNSGTTERKKPNKTELWLKDLYRIQTNKLTRFAVAIACNIFVVFFSLAGCVKKKYRLHGKCQAYGRTAEKKTSQPPDTSECERKPVHISQDEQREQQICTHGAHEVVMIATCKSVLYWLIIGWNYDTSSDWCETFSLDRLGLIVVYSKSVQSTPNAFRIWKISWGSTRS